MRPFTPVRAAVAAGVIVVALLAGVLVGAVTRDARSAPVRAAAQNPVPVLEPIGFGDEAPSAEFLAGLAPPDPAAQAEARRAALVEHADELGDTDVDPDDVPVREVTVADLPVSGYADAGGDAEAVDGKEALPDGADDATPSSSDATEPSPDTEPAAGDETGDEVDDELPGIVDLCAVDDPPPGCDGVAGTVVLAQHEPFRFVEPPAVSATATDCPDLRRDVEPDEFVIRLLTNHLGEFTVVYRVENAADPGIHEIAGQTPAGWADALDDGAEHAVTCLIGDRPDGPGPVRLEISLTGVGADDSGTAHWADVVDVPAFAERRDGRPPIEVDAITASRLQVTVPARDGERVNVTLADRHPDGTHDCTAPVEGGVPVITAVPGGVRVMSEWERRVFTVMAPEAGAYVLCVEWTDGFQPPRDVESAVVPVDIAGSEGVEISSEGYTHNPCSGMGCPTRPVHLSLRTLIGGTSEDCGLGSQVALRPSDARVVCRVARVPSWITFETQSSFHEDPSTPGAFILDGTLGRFAARIPRCAEDTCTTWYAVPVRAPGGLLEGNGGVTGSVVVSVRVTGGGPGNVVIGDERPEAIDHDAFDGPRLRWDRVSAEPDPDNPSRGAIVRWATDVPATVEVIAQSDYDSACLIRSTAVTEHVTEGEVRLDRLCPGMHHRISFVLQDENGRTTHYDAMAVPDVDVNVVPRSAYVDLEPMAVTYDYEVTFKELRRAPGGGFEEVTGRGVVPRRMQFRFPGGHRHDYSQWYDGSAYVGLDCADPAHFNLSGSGVPVDLEFARFAPTMASFEFQTYAPEGPESRRCPNIGDQFDHRGGPGAAVCTAEWNLEWPRRGFLVDDQLAGTGMGINQMVPLRCDGDDETTYLFIRIHWQMRSS